MVEDKDALHFTAFDATPGEKYRQWRQDLMSYAATRTDESGSSLADSLRDVDMGGGGAGAPAYPGAATLREKMQRLHTARAKASYALIYKHVSDGDLRTILYTQCFQDGHAALVYLDGAYDTPITRTELRNMDKLWTELSIAQDIGIAPDSISRFVKLLQRVNSQRPAANRYNNTEMCEKLLEAIADASRHFNEGAQKEYDAPAGSRQFEYPAAHPTFPGQRNFGACGQYYDNQWKQAVKAKILTPTGPLRREHAAARQVVDIDRPGVSASPQERSPSPAAMLAGLLANGAEIPSNTATTSDFDLQPEDFAQAVAGGNVPEHGDVEQCYDAEGTPSVELICDNCRGIGHPRRLCPSPRRYRTFEFALELLRRARDRADTRAKLDKRPRFGRRPPPRGQRPPFRPTPRPPINQPRRFQPDARQISDSASDPPSMSTAPSAAEPSQPLSFADEDYFDSSEPLSAMYVQADDRSASPSRHSPTSIFWSPATNAVALLLLVVVAAGSWTQRVTEAALVAARGGLTLRVALASVLVVLAAGVFGRPTEHLGLLVGRTQLTGVVACVDSGASISCISERLATSGEVNFHETNKSLHRRLRVANGQLLEIVAEGTLNLHGVSGYRFIDGQKLPSRGDAVFSNVAVVRGLADGIVLLSVRALKRQNIRAYFNDDNEHHVDECLRLPCGLFIPFIPSTHDLPLPAAVDAMYAWPRSPWDVSHRIHAALCHAGATRISLSRLTYSGRPLPAMPPPYACRGCRLGGSRAPPSYTGRKRAERPALARGPLDHYGQLVYSDCCVGFPASFPHGFTAMVNFCDGYSGERDRRYLTRADSAQVLSALTEYCRTNRHRMKDGRIGVWQTDNGKEFRGECLTDAVEGMLDRHDFAVPNARNSNAIAERDWGVIERGMRACLAHADDAPECLWSWAAFQCSQVYFYLATTIHQPPASPHDFLNPGRAAVDMTWAKVLFCDVVVALPERDIRGKLWHRSADGCHLGYDARRRGHIVYCPRYRRLGTFTVTDWCGENSFTLCKLITADTPVEYHQVEDLPMAPATAALLPAHFRAGRAPGAAGANSAQETLRLRQALEHQTRQDGNWFALRAGEVESTLQRLSPTEVGIEVGYQGVSEPPAGQTPCLPDTIEKARASPFWPMVKDALESEIQGKFVDNNAWDVVPRTANMHVIKSKWVLKWSLNPDGSVAGVKARLVACGYAQVEGREFTAVYARTLAAPSFRLFCSIVADENLETDHVDAYKAFTQSTVDCIIYVEMPYGFSREGYVLKLNKALEGIRQGAHLWMEHNKAVLLKLGFKQSMSEASLYKHSEVDIIIAVFADDIAAAFATSVESTYRRIKDEYMAQIRVRTSDITPLTMFTGVSISRDRGRGTLTINQPAYIDQLSRQYEGKFVARSTPGPTAAAARREFEKMQPGQPGELIDKVKYLRLIGALIWPASMTRPDLAYFVSYLASFNGAPTQQHYDAALNVLGYLVATRTMGITYGGELKIPMGLKEYPPGFVESRGLHAYHDSSWGTAPRPFGGYVIMRCNRAVNVSSRTLKIVPDSTAQAETAMASKAAKDTVAARIVCEDIGRTVQGPTALIGDNKAAYDIIVKSGLTARTRYFERATLIVKRFYMLLMVVPYLVPTTAMVADILTKCADKQTFYRMRSYMLNSE